MEEQIKTLKNDHDVIVTLVEAFKNLKESQDKFHFEMREAVKDLKENYSTRLDNHETRLNALETSKTKQNTLMSIGIGILTLLVSLLIYHLTK